MARERGGFTLPGEAGYEELTLQLAKRWGADVIRDSDGTALSDELIQAGYDIYSTICIIRDHNQWAAENKDKLQQTFLCTPAVVARGHKLKIGLMESFFAEQFAVNEEEASLAYWQVYDRTTNELVPPTEWAYDGNGSVLIHNAQVWHKYTVSFLAYRIWEEISMYNHITNQWEKEHLMQLEPQYPEVQEYLLAWMKEWCENHPDTDVVRFTSLFYNFVWIWGSDIRNRNLFTDWGSYDFTVSVPALEAFEKAYGYRLTAEDFINKGALHVTHMPAGQRQRDYMEFINGFVIQFGKKLIDIVHTYGKKAYVFYDDSWVGIEPYNGRFAEFGFDGLIKCVFSGYEARLCAGVDIPVHEIRLHPYLFPIGLGGAPTFSGDGDPTTAAKEYWINVRRALLREPIERIGLGGYLHLVEGYPEFCDYIEKVADEFRLIQSFHQDGKPYCQRPRVAILHTWGKLRSWTLSGHFHETYMHDLIHVIEALAGLPLDVKFLSFADIQGEALQEIDVIINAGYAGSAWSGGAAWEDAEMVSVLTAWVDAGGTFIGINEPSAVPGYDTYFRMAHVLGIDEDNGARVCHGKWQFEVNKIPGLDLTNVALRAKEKRFLTDGRTAVVLADGDDPIVTVNEFGKGKGIYLSEFTVSAAHTRLLHQLLLFACEGAVWADYMTDNPDTECAYYPASRRLVVINNSAKPQKTIVIAEEGRYEVELKPYDTVFINE